VELGAGRMLKEFEEGLVGMKKGDEKTVDVTYAELIKSFGVESGEIEDFRKDVKANMEKELANKIKVKVKNAVMDALLQKNDVETPSAMVAEEIRNLKLQMLQNMGQDPAKADLSTLPDDLFKEEAEKRVNGRRPDQERGHEHRSGTLPRDPRGSGFRIEYYSKNADARTSLEGLVLEDQVVDLILDKARVSEQSLGFEEMMNQPG